MKTLLELCRERVSVRQYSSRLPEASDVDYVLECLRLAPSAVNRQPWRVYYVTGAEPLSGLRQSYPREWFAQAPAVVVLSKCEDEQWVRPADGHAHGDIDVAIAAEHFCLAAAERGLATCWVCNFDLTLCRTALNIPEGETPVVMLPLGYAAEGFADAGRKRKAMAEILVRC